MKRYRIVIAGCGGMANTWADYAAVTEDADVVGLVDIRPEAAQAFAGKRGWTCPVFTGVEEAIRTTNANLVFDVTIPEAHHATVTAAVTNGCHCMGEKPMAGSMEEAKRVLATVRTSGKTYAVMQNRRYLKQIRAYRDLIHGGAIGKPGYIGCQFFMAPHFGGFREQMDSPLIVDMAIHHFDMARFLLKADPVTVYCQEFNLPGSWYGGKAAAVCIYEMSDGSVFSYNGSWCSEGAPTSWEGEWRTSGSKGTAIWDGRSQPYAEAVKEGAVGFTRETVRIDAQDTWAGKEGHHGCLDEMFAALREGRPAETDAADNIKSLAMVYGAVESARSGRKVRIADLLA